MMKKFTQSVALRHGWLNIMVGGTLFLEILAEHSSNTVFRNIGYTLSILTLIFLISSYFFKLQPDDERSEANADKAGHLAFLITETLLLLSLALNIIFHNNLPLKDVLNAVVATGAIASGILFFSFEKH